MQRFFLHAIRRINEQYPALFDEQVDGEGDSEGSSGGGVDTFAESFGWINNAKVVSEFENIPLESVWSLGVIQFMNDLLYLKMKAKHDAEKYKPGTS